MKSKDLYDYLNQAVPSSLSCDWDNDGLMVMPDPDREIRRVLVALDITDAILSEAITRQADLILSHHPLIFHPLRSLTDPKLIRMVQAGIAAISLHTRLDKTQGGVNDCLAEKLGLKDVTPFGEDGLGRRGTLPSPMTPEELAQYVKKCLSAPMIQMTSGKKSCRTLALVGGDGKDYLCELPKAQVDAYLTGDLSYNCFCDCADASSHTVLSAGHFYTENPVCEALGALVLRADPQIEILYRTSNPVRIL